MKSHMLLRSKAVKYPLLGEAETGYLGFTSHRVVGSSQRDAKYLLFLPLHF